MVTERLIRYARYKEVQEHQRDKGVTGDKDNQCYKGILGMKDATGNNEITGDNFKNIGTDCLKVGIHLYSGC